MARKKSAKKKRPGKKQPPSTKLGVQLLKTLVGFVLLVVLVMAAGVWLYYLMARKETPLPHPETIKPYAGTPPAYEIFPEVDDLPKPVTPGPLPPSGKTPRVAIIIDDLGYDPDIAAKFLKVDGILTLAILPHSPFQKSIARAAKMRGFEVMLHLPLEPNEYPQVNPGPGTLVTTMSPDMLIKQLRANLAAVPHISGVNNHMGSKLTASSAQLYQIFSVLKQEGLFFIDSRTTTKTICKPSARLLRIPFAQRDIFLDHQPVKEIIEKQLDRLVRLSKARGYAVGIGHPHEMTANVLKRALPKLKKQVVFVAVSEVVAIPG